MATDIDKFTLGEAQRQIGTLWEVVSEIRDEVKDLSVETAKTQEIISNIGEQISTIASGMAMLTGKDAIAKEVAEGLRIENLERAVEKIKANPCSTCQHKADIIKLKGTVKILKWIAGILSGVSVVVLGKVLLQLLSLALK